jgi:hypothetical protein
MTAPWAPKDPSVRIPSNIIECIEDERWWGQWFRDQETWRAWKVALKAMFALEMSADELAIFKQHTGRETPPSAQVKEFWAVVGRRGGKSRLMATVAAYLAAFHDWRPYLAAGKSEMATIQLIAGDRKQARTLMRYLRSLITEHGLLKQLVTREGGEWIELSCGVSIEIATCSYRSTRGYTVCACIADEIAFWMGDDSTNPAGEVINAIKPAMSTMPGSLLMAISSPHARSGPLWGSYRKHFGKDSGRVLVWKATTAEMNPTVDADIISEALEADPSRAAAEYLAEFRTDVETYISRETVDACIVPGRHELPRISGVSYVAFCDPSGGSSDSFTIGIAHRDRATGHAILDAIRERRPPFSPDAVVNEFVGLLESYGIHKVTGDRYAAQWPVEAFRKLHVTYVASELTKSQLYQELLPILNAGRCELLDHPRLIAQLCSLERRTARGGRDSIDHPPHSHDDVANAVAGGLVLVGAKTSWFSVEGVQREMRAMTRYAALRQQRAAMGRFY